MYLLGGFKEVCKSTTRVSEHLLMMEGPGRRCFEGLLMIEEVCTWLCRGAIELHKVFINILFVCFESTP